MNGRRPGPARDRLHPVEGLLAVAVGFLLLPTIGAPLQARFGLLGVALTEVAAIALPLGVVLLAAARRPEFSTAAALGLARPTVRGWGGAAIAGAAGFYLVAGGLELLQDRLAPLPPELRAQLRRLILPPGGPRPLVVDLAVLAVVPALCEETLFRGALLRALAPLDRSTALLFTSLAFGAFHYSLYKLLPTATLGLLLGAIALRAGSLWPAVLAHALNNALVVLLVRSGYEDPPGAGSAIAWLALVPAAAALAGGLMLIRRNGGADDSEAARLRH